MNKSKSQQAIPTVPAGSDFIYRFEDDTYVFQTKDLLMQVHFRSAIKEVSEYMEQYEKYSFLSEISSVGIKASQERFYYDQVSEAIRRDFHKYLEKTARYIEKMIMNIQMMKSERWHYYAQVVKLYKHHLLRKDLDCYDFKPEQFAENLHRVEQYLKGMNTRHDPSTMKKVKQEIKAGQKLISNKLNQIHDNMFVKNPFKPQNIKFKEVDSSQLFAAYMKKLAYTTDNLETSLQFKFHMCFEKISDFYISLKQFCLEGQRIALGIIKDYNQYIPEDVNLIEKPRLIEKDSKQVQISEHTLEWKKNMKANPILVNKVERIQVSNRLLVKNEEQDRYLIYLNDSQSKIMLPYEQEQFNNNRIPGNNPYIDYWALTYERDKLNKLQLYLEYPRRNKGPGYSNGYVQMQEAFNKMSKKKEEDRQIVKENIYYECLCHRKEQEENISRFKSGKNQRQTKAYEIIVDQSHRGNFIHFPSTVEEHHDNLNKVEKLQNRIKRYRQLSEKERRLEEQFFPPKYHKDYRQFSTKFGLENTKQDATATSVFRYGIQISRTLYQNTNVSKFQEFLYYCLKEKMYREIPACKDKASMPIIFNAKPAAEFCDWRVVKKLGELTQNFKRYYIWASEVIKYEQIVSIRKQVRGKFTIYAYSKPENGQKLLFQLKRRLNMKVGGEVFSTYDFGNCSSLDSALSKLELLHRLVFNQHLEAPTPQLSAEKGRQMFNSIVKGFSNTKQ